MTKFLNYIGYFLIGFLIYVSFFSKIEFSNSHFSIAMIGASLCAIPTPYKLNLIKLFGWLLIIASAFWYGTNEEGVTFVLVIAFICGVLLSGLKGKGNDNTIWESDGSGDGGD